MGVDGKGTMSRFGSFVAGGLRGLGLEVSRVGRPNRRFQDECADIQGAYCGVSVDTIFDVGANVGAFAKHYKRCFPSATVMCFEPDPSTFEILLANVGHVKGVKGFCMALGETRGRARMHSIAGSGCNSLNSSVVSREGEGRHIDVEVDTLEGICEKQEVRQIDILKTDTEGYDAKVLGGARAMLEDGRVAFVVSECTFFEGDKRHTAFNELVDILQPCGFRVFGFYRQRFWRNYGYHWTDVMFVRPDAVRYGGIVEGG